MGFVSHCVLERMKGDLERCTWHISHRKEEEGDGGGGSEPGTSSRAPGHLLLPPVAGLHPAGDQTSVPAGWWTCRNSHWCALILGNCVERTQHPHGDAQEMAHVEPPRALGSVFVLEARGKAAVLAAER